MVQKVLLKTGADHKAVRVEEIKVSVEEKKKNTGYEKGFSTSLWYFTTFFFFSFSHHF